MFTLTVILFKKHWNIDIININKIKNIFASKKIKKTLSKEEKYLEKIPIDTFDGSGYTTHPYILELDKPLNGYKYYMTHTPYANHNIELENPSLCVSNDGINFQKPKGVKDPLLPIIKKGENGKGKFYNDSFMFYEDGKLQVWYRYTEEDKTGPSLKAKSQIKRIVSKDGINFEKPELIIDFSDIWYLSPSLIKIYQTYYLYYYDQDLKMYVITSQNLKKWSNPQPIILKNYSNNCWHGEVKLINDKLYLLLLSRDYKLYLGQTDTKNPLEFNMSKKLELSYYDSLNIYGNAHPYKSTFLIKKGYIDLYIPFAVNKINYFKIRSIKHVKYTMTHTKLKLDRFLPSI